MNVKELNILADIFNVPRVHIPTDDEIKAEYDALMAEMDKVVTKETISNIVKMAFEGVDQ